MGCEGMGRGVWQCGVWGVECEGVGCEGVGRGVWGVRVYYIYITVIYHSLYSCS